MTIIKGVKNSIVALGDSLTQSGSSVGSPTHDNVGWVNFLKWMLGCQIINSGISGNTLPQMLARINGDVLVHNPSHCIIFGGTNDIQGNFDTIANMPTNLSNIVQTLTENGIEPIVINLPPVFNGDTPKLTRTIEFNGFLESYCVENNFVLIDIFSMFIDGLGNEIAGMQYDHLHFTVHANYLVATLLKNELADDIQVYKHGNLYVKARTLANNAFLTDDNTDGLANGWYKSQTAGVTNIPALSAHPAIGKWQQISITGGVSLDSSSSVYSEITGWVEGCYLDVSCDIDTDANLNGCEWAVSIMTLNATYAPTGLSPFRISGGKCSEPVTYMNVWDTILIPTTTTSVWIYFHLFGSGTTTARVGNVVCNSYTEIRRFNKNIRSNVSNRVSVNR